MIQNAEDEVAELAKEAAKADAMARAAKAAELGQAQQLELQRLKVGSWLGTAPHARRKPWVKFVSEL